MNNTDEIKKALKRTKIEDVWGIGKRLSFFLKKNYILTAEDFILLDRSWIKKNMGIIGEKIYLELMGISCLDLDLIPIDKKSCCVSRSFNKPVEKIEDLEEAISSYGSRVSEKIRGEGLVAQSMNIFILTNYFNKKDRQYSNSIKLQLPFPSNNSIQIVKKALEGIHHIYRKNYKYKKVGIILHELTKASQTRGLLDIDRSKSDLIMKTIDGINYRYGASTLKIASEGIEKKWSMKREKISPCYTTRFNELMEVRC